MRPAFEQSNSTLKNTRDFVSESKFLTNWLDVEHEGWKLPATTEPHEGPSRPDKARKQCKAMR